MLYTFTHIALLQRTRPPTHQFLCLHCAGPPGAWPERPLTCAWGAALAFVPFAEGPWHSLHHPRPELSILAALNAGPARIHGCTLGRIAAIHESQRRSGAQSRHRRSSARAITSLPTPPSRPTNCPDTRDPQAHGEQNILPFRLVGSPRPMSLLTSTLASYASCSQTSSQ